MKCYALCLTLLINIIALAQSPLKAHEIQNHTTHPAEIITLKTPDLSPDKIKRYSAGIRPCRTSGIRLEAEKIDTKLIIHNYGHGGSGISLSWGCAQEAVNILRRTTSEHLPIAIIGAGVMGLTTAHILKDLGYEVTVYARDFVPNTTSNKAAGVWSPHFGSNFVNKELFNQIEAYSYARLYDFATDSTPHFNGIFILPRYTEKAEYSVTDKLPKDHVIVQVNGHQKVCKRRLELVFDLNIYLQDLFDKAQSKQVHFVQEDFASCNTLLELQEPVIFNCTGLGSRELFNDRDLYGVKGHIIVFEAQPEIDYAVCNMHQKQNIFFSLISWKTQLVLGGTLENGIEDLSVNETVIEELLTLARAFFNHR